MSVEVFRDSPAFKSRYDALLNSPRFSGNQEKTDAFVNYYMEVHKNDFDAISYAMESTAFTLYSPAPERYLNDEIVKIREGLLDRRIAALEMKTQTIMPEQLALEAKTATRISDLEKKVQDLMSRDSWFKLITAIIVLLTSIALLLKAFG